MTKIDAAAVTAALADFKDPEARDGFDPAKSAQLWLAHSLEAVLGVGAPPASCVDYDTLLDVSHKLKIEIVHD